MERSIRGCLVTLHQLQLLFRFELSERIVTQPEMRAPNQLPHLLLALRMTGHIPPLPPHAFVTCKGATFTFTSIIYGRTLNTAQDGRLLIKRHLNKVLKPSEEKLSLTQRWFKNSNNEKKPCTSQDLPTQS
jgi:hypothetical protein